MCVYIYNVNIYIYDVYIYSAAKECGTIRPGMVLTHVNGEDLGSMSSERAALFLLGDVTAQAQKNSTDRFSRPIDLATQQNTHADIHRVFAVPLNFSAMDP